MACLECPVQPLGRKDGGSEGGTREGMGVGTGLMRLGRGEAASLWDGWQGGPLNLLCLERASSMDPGRLDLVDMALWEEP